jgi:hypothetical protein
LLDVCAAEHAPREDRSVCAALARGTTAAITRGMNKNIAVGLALAAVITAFATAGCASSIDEPLRNDDELAAKEAYARSEASKSGADTTKTQSCWVGWDTCCYSGYCCSWWTGTAQCSYHVP